MSRESEMVTLRRDETGNPKAKLRPEQVDEIRRSKGSSYSVATRYGVNATTVQRIRKGKAWAS